jgi:hypothetical protein
MAPILRLQLMVSLAACAVAVMSVTTHLSSLIFSAHDSFRLAQEVLLIHILSMGSVATHVLLPLNALLAHPSPRDVQQAPTIQPKG